MADVIFLENVIVSMSIGCSEEERRFPQPVCLSIWMDFDCEKAGRSGKLNDTLDYVKAYQLVVETSQSREYVLLERFCEILASALFDLGTDKVRIRAFKERCPIPGMSGRVGVEIERSKGDIDS